jgi:pseudouridine synthase
MIEYPVRLQVYLAKCGVGSRRSCEALIAEGRVSVNNKTVREMGVKVSENDIVQVDLETVEPNDKLYYFALNKPRGFVCTNYDPNEDRYARDLIQIRDQNLLFNVGRLDKDSMGLILFTNDGDFAQKVTHPRFEIEKEYLVHTSENINEADLMEAVKGVYIDLKVPYRIKSFEMQSKSWVKVILTEGKNREIRKIFSYLGYDVKSLTRVRIGCITLGELAVGDYRALTKKEIDGLLAGKTSLYERKKFGKAAIRKPKAE